jgi:hypothetical protein
LPVRKDDEVVVLRGTHKGHKGKIIQVFRKKWIIHIDKLTKNKATVLHTKSQSMPQTLPSPSLKKEKTDWPELLRSPLVLLPERVKPKRRSEQPTDVILLFNIYIFQSFIFFSNQEFSLNQML